MKLVTWNIKGVNKIYKQKELQVFLNESKTSIIASLENKVKERNAQKIIDKVTSQWQWHANHNHSDKGRIWVLWDNTTVDFTEIANTDQMIHGYIKSCSSQVEFYFTAVYGWHTVETRKSLWTQLDSIATGVNGPWLIMGDFDRTNGSVVQESEVGEFKDRLSRIGLCEMKTVGREYTWTNGHVYSRIDKALANPAWMTTMAELDVEIQNARCSDHSPLVIDFAEPNWRRPRPFKFMNHLVQHQDFQEAVQRGWNKPALGNSMTKVWIQLKQDKN
ncbi:hypothetical protein RDI58_018359 [Solanum bulbocastanum]|uniref:Endonuclease/exonuclease/phosphatase domain-containing protein n=1 Tax=Solanum bulbocastanum TaxID=147425 RepID=A0AAN8TBH6_SOLBU